MKFIALSFLIMTGCASAPAIVAPAVSQLDAVLRDPAYKALPEASRSTLAAAVTQAKAEVSKAEKSAVWAKLGALAVSFVAGLVFGVIIRRF